MESKPLIQSPRLGPGKIHPWLAASIFSAVLLAAGALAFRSLTREAPPAPFSVSDFPSATGTVRVSLYGPEAVASTGPGSPSASDPGESPSSLTRHQTTWVNGPFYSGMEDNDLRGHLDGTYKYAWNQATQVEVRVGRRPNGPKYGEHEIFRVAQRWEGIQLPVGSVVRRARLSIEVIEAPPDTLRLMLYEVKKDWDPGKGGVLHNNVSPPTRGEVWWGEVAHAESRWALPGVSYANDEDPNADTGATPLAEAVFYPGHSLIAFESRDLAEYATRRIQEHAPLLFLLKMADPYEDTPGAMVMVHSGNAGDTRAISRRPHLTLEWESSAEIAHFERPLLIERGRHLVLPRMEAKGARTMAVTFLPDSSSILPTIGRRTGMDDELGAEVRGVGNESADAAATRLVPDVPPRLGTLDAWTQVNGVADLNADWAEIRVLAAIDPIELGQPFRATMSETWIRTAPPEDQIVPWRFVSPSQVVYERTATYVGDWTWAIEFVPNEVGPWTYSWQADWSESHFDSEVGHFDVIGGDLSNVRRALLALASELDTLKTGNAEALGSAMNRFARLERAALLEIGPTRFASATGDSIRAQLRSLRKVLGGEEVPDSIPMVPDKPPLWQREAQRAGR